MPDAFTFRHVTDSDDCARRVHYDRTAETRPQSINLLVASCVREAAASYADDSLDNATAAHERARERATNMYRRVIQQARQLEPAALAAEWPELAEAGAFDDAASPVFGGYEKLEQSLEGLQSHRLIREAAVPEWKGGHILDSAPPALEVDVADGVRVRTRPHALIEDPATDIVTAVSFRTSSRPADSHVMELAAWARAYADGGHLKGRALSAVVIYVRTGLELPVRNQHLEESAMFLEDRAPALAALLDEEALPGRPDAKARKRVCRYCPHAAVCA